MSAGSSAGRPTDPLQLAAEARAQRRTIGRLHNLVKSSLAIVWRASKTSSALTMAMQVLQALFLVAQIWAVQLLLEALLEADQVGARGAIWPAVLLAAVTAASALISAVQSYFNRFLGECVSKMMLERVLAAASTVHLSYFESPEFYDRLSRVQAQASSKPYQVAQGLMAMIGSSITTVSVGITLAAIYPPLLILLIIGGVPAYLANRRAGRREFEFTLARTPSIRLRTYVTFLQTNREAAKEIRAFDLAPSLGQRFQRLYGEHLLALKSHLKRQAWLSMIGNGGTAIALAVTLLAVIWLIATGRMTVASAGAAIVAIRLLQGQIQALYSGMQSILESGLFLDDVDTFLALADVDSTNDGTKDVPATFEKLDAHGISFTYPGSDKPAVSGVSLSIHSGEVVALVGENGSGKTTLAKLLAGLYNPDVGEVYWDATPLREFEVESLRARIAVIFQDFTRFAFSARDNIAPRGDGRDDHIVHAAHAAGATAMLNDLPDGLDTMLSRMFRDGVDLSGGQWQRIAIARAFYKDAPFVILDEPTSALDPRAEHDLFRTLRDTLSGRSAVFVSHRFSTVREADRIVVLDQGRIIEQGTHDALMAIDGTYAELFQLQARAFTG